MDNTPKNRRAEIDKNTDNLSIPKTDDSRRDFLKTGLKGALLLPYVAPLVQTVSLTDAKGRGNTGNSAPASVIGNAPPPPAPAPRVRSCTPNDGDLDQTLTVTIGGDNFQNTPDVDFGSGVQVQSVTFLSDARLSVSIRIRSSTSPGPRTIEVTNPDGQSDTLINGFTVNPPPPPPSIRSCNPNSGSKGESMSITISGTDFIATPTVDFGSRIDVHGVSYFSSTTLVASISIRSNAGTGNRNVKVKNPDNQKDTLRNGFTVTGGDGDDDDDDDDDDD